MENYLLRFRDTINLDTILEHQNIINTYGYTWWGWWKKISEPEKGDLFNDIKKNLSNSRFFLFDRSSNRFFAILVSEISFSKNEKILSPEKEKTPHYYNNQSCSLWLKLTHFENISMERFIEIFEIIPSYDYTFFTQNDIRQELSVLKGKNKRLKLNSDYILHLSDIHFGADFGFPSTPAPSKRPLIEILTNYVKNELKEKIGLLIISGDITSRGNGNVLLNQGLVFLNKLCENLKIKKDCVIIIPGNHDIPLQETNFIDYNHENAFRFFLEKFYGSIKEPFGLDYFEFPCGKKVDILRIHSVKLRKIEESNYGYVDWSHYENLLSSHNLDGDLRIAIIHHHLVTMQVEEILDPTYPYGSISVTIDSGRVIEGLQKNGFDFVLNGHQHIPGITKITRGVINNINTIDLNERKDLTILSAGSAGVKDERFSNEMKYNSFSIYQI
ncbi:MAG TPA: metallophosphoesterase [Bacteroidia bacterium]|nr:metallophosphoesterase [Bacteroidia bacterium]